MTQLEALTSRHSIRKYIDRPLEPEVVGALQEEISRLNEEGNLSMQLVLDEPKAFKSLLAYGVFSNVKNYVMVVGQKSKTLEIRAGYYTQLLVLFAQQLALNTCIVGLTYKKIDGAFAINPDQKVVVCVAIGYGADNGRPHKIKSPNHVSNISDTTPEWFNAGISAALLAPTALNQQKFYFEYIPPITPADKPSVWAKRGFSLAGYTKVDLGIAMCNFTIGAKASLESCATDNYTTKNNSNTSDIPWNWIVTL